MSQPPHRSLRPRPKSNLCQLDRSGRAKTSCRSSTRRGDSSGILKPVDGCWCLVSLALRGPAPRLTRSNYLYGWAELTTASSFAIMITFPILYWIIEQARQVGYVNDNPIKYLLFLQGKLPNGQYTRVWSDLLFVLHHVIFWSLCVFSILSKE